MTAEKIRDSILLYAIKGALVHQDAKEAPASSLVEEIDKKRAELITDRRIKKTIKTVPFTEEDELFEIPNGWQWCRLGDLLSIVSDGTHQTPKYVDYGVPFLSVQNISSGHLDMSKAKYISEEEHKILVDRVKPQKGDILICRIGTLGKAIEVTWDFDFSIFVSLGLLRPIDNRVTPFLIKVINSPWGKQWIDKVKVGGGTHTNKINLSDIPSCPIPLPPLEEQRRILAKIDELAPLVDEYKKTAEELNALNESLPDKLRKSVLQEAIKGTLVSNDIPEGEATAQELLQQILKERQDQENKEKGKKAKKLTLSTIEEEPWDLPEGWCWTQIGDLFDHSAGKSLNSSKQSIGRVYQYLTTSNVYWEGINFDKVKEMAFTEEEYKKCSAIKNDILVCEGGDVGRSCIWTYEYTIGLQNHVHRLRAIKNTDVKFFYYVLRFYKAAGIITAKGIGIGGFSANALKGLSVPLPPLSIQHRIVEKIEEVFSAINNL